MKILVTGSGGFIGKNLIVALKNCSIYEVFEFEMGTAIERLEEYCSICNFVYHLAGVNRPAEISQFMEGNADFLSLVLHFLEKHKNNCPVMLSSSIHASNDNPYGLSKRAAEDRLLEYAIKNSAKTYIYRFPNVFGKWCKPNYNSVVATFCYNIAHDLPVSIHDAHAEINLVYIDDVVVELLSLLKKPLEKEMLNFLNVPVVYHTTIGELAKQIYLFRNTREDLSIPDMTDGGLIKKLYSTYLSYLPENAFKYSLKMNTDERGSFTELMKTEDRGQFSVNITKPGIEKGNHWHHSKNEKFIVVSGNALIQLREIHSKIIVNYRVSGDKIEVVDIPVGYTHKIINVGKCDLVTIIWCNECYNSTKPDTYYLKVQEDKCI